MAEFKKRGLQDGAGEDDFKYDPEAEDSGKKYRLPYALCKQRGIEIQDWWAPRDAWAVLRRDGVDPGDEYKKYYDELAEKRRQEKKELAKRQREKQKAKKAQLANEDINPTKGYTHIDGVIDGAEKGKPMTFEQADSGHVNPHINNPHYHGYHHNCQTCVATYVARRQGYNVTALPNLNNKNIFALSHDTSLAYIDDNGKNPEKTAMEKGANREKWFNDHIKPGEIHTVEFMWAGKNSGHIITAEKHGNDVRLYDPQTNKIYSGEEIQRFLRKTRNIETMNLTNCRLDEKFCNKIMKGVKSK